MPAYTVTIRLDGKYGGNSMKPRRFDGFLYWETRKLRTVINLQQPNGEFVQEIREQDSIPLLVFEKGNWMKSKKLKRAVGLPEEERPITLGAFLRALDKVILKVKKKSSVRGKKGTSG